MVLVVDDEPMVLRLMQRALASGGCKVHAAADGLVSGYGPPADFGELPGPLLPKPFDSQQLLVAVRRLLAPPDTSRRSS